MDDQENKKKKRVMSEEKKAMLTEDAALGEIASDEIFERDPELAKELAEDRKIQERALEYKKKQEERAKKRKKRIIIILIVIVIIAIASFAGYKIYKAKKDAENSEAIVQATEDQELVYAEITKIAGNNITVTLLEEQDSATVAGSDGAESSAPQMGEAEDTASEDAAIAEDSSDEGSSESGEAGSNDSQKSGKGGMGGPQSGEAPSGDMPSGEAPSGEMPSGENDMASGGQMPSAESGESTNVVTYVETETGVEYQIPVGTSVITKLGTSATFSSLSTGDVIAIALEKGTDIIDKVWIIQ
jgi:hypothetical protein